MNNLKHNRRSAFTLIEVIVALVLISIAGAMMATLISRSLVQVNRPREMLAEAFLLQSVMENIVARHSALSDVDVLSQEVGGEGIRINNSFGLYTVQHNRFVWFDGFSQEIGASATNNLLKISIQNDLGEKITRLFARKL